MSRSWGRAHLRWLLREPPARPLPGAALSRVTAAEVAASSGQEAETRGPKEPETEPGRRGAPRTAPRPGPRAPRPSPRALARPPGEPPRRARSLRPRRPTARAAASSSAGASRTPSRNEGRFLLPWHEEPGAAGAYPRRWRPLLALLHRPGLGCDSVLHGGGLSSNHGLQ